MSKYTLNIPIQINGGEGVPEDLVLLPRELYFDSTANILYCGMGENNKPAPIQLAKLADNITDILKSGDIEKTINNATLQNTFIESYDGVVDNFDALKNKEPGLYFVKVGS